MIGDGSTTSIKYAKLYCDDSLQIEPYCANVVVLILRKVPSDSEVARDALLSPSEFNIFVMYV